MGDALLLRGPSKDTLEQALKDVQAMVDEVDELGSVLLGAGANQATNDDIDAFLAENAPDQATNDDIDAFLAENAPDKPQAAAAVGGGYAPAPLPVHAAAAYAPAVRAGSPSRHPACNVM